MKAKFVTALTLGAFVLLNIYAFAGGLQGLLDFVTEGDRWTLLVVCDVGIALSLISVWIFQDARRRGVSPMPYLALTWTTGSIGPLVYLLKRPDLL